MATVRLRAGHVRPVWAGHPWVFAQAIERVEGAPSAGDVVAVVDPEGKLLGRGFWSPRSAIPVRILTREPHEVLDGAWIGRRLDDAAAFRRGWLGIPSADSTGYRLVHGEGDGLAGLVVDVYGTTAAVQILTAGMARHAEEIFGHVARVAHASTVLAVGVERNEREGFELPAGVVRGPDIDLVQFKERGFDFEIPSEGGQKTGFYFDQRDNRARVETLARDRRVLDAYSYVGAFGLSAARGGAREVVCLDSSPLAITQAAVLAKHHRLDATMSFLREDVRHALPRLADEGRRFDLVVLDPPKLAPTAKHLERAKTAYRKANALAFRLLAPDGVLVTCSCSAALGVDDLQRLVALAARDADREATVFARGDQAPDHPVPAAFPQGRYLKALFVHAR